MGRSGSGVGDPRAVNDGGSGRPFGWGRFHPNLDTLDGSPTAQIAPGLRGELAWLRL